MIYFYKGFTVCSPTCLEELLCDSVFDTDSDYTINTSVSSDNSSFDTSMEDLNTELQELNNKDFSLSHI